MGSATAFRPMWWATSCAISGYSLQANRKTREGTEHPDRDAQFGYINRKVQQALAANEPAISVDTKKKGALQKRGNGFDMN